jgi:hypothetical protein
MARIGEFGPNGRGGPTILKGEPGFANFAANASGSCTSISIAFQPNVFIGT